MFGENISCIILEEGEVVLIFGEGGAEWTFEWIIF